MTGVLILIFFILWGPPLFCTLISCIRRERLDYMRFWFAHWRMNKSAVLWVTIIALSYMSFMGIQFNKTENEARIKWRDYQAEIMEQVAELATHEEFKYHSPEEMEKVIERYLKEYLRIESLPYFSALPKEERQNFIVLAQSVAEKFHAAYWNENLMKSALPDAVIPHSLADQIAGD